jgi:hypothetical protein
MTEPGAPDPINPNAAGIPERVQVDGSPPGPRKDFLPLLYLLGFLVLAGSLFYLWRNPSMPAGAEQEAARVDTLQQQLQSSADRLTQLEQRPAPAPPPSLAPLEARIAALERRPAPDAAPPLDFGPITTRLDSAISKQTADLQGVAAQITGRLDALEGRLAAVEKQGSGVVGQINGIVSKQTADLQGVTARLDGRLDALESRLTATEKQGSGIAGQIGGITEQAQRISRVQLATTALEAGQKLGDIPGAPPALAQFAHDAPPTEAGLRLSFNSAAEAAQRASQPAIMDNQPFASRLWTRAQQSVTVRQGDRVLLGDPVSGVLAHARQALDAGDLAGAVAVLNGLAGPAAAAMADWVGQARALLEARAALASMAARG